MCRGFWWAGGGGSWASRAGLGPGEGEGAALGVLLDCKGDSNSRAPYTIQAYTPLSNSIGAWAQPAQLGSGPAARARGPGPLFHYLKGRGYAYCHRWDILDVWEIFMNCCCFYCGCNNKTRGSIENHALGWQGLRGRRVGGRTRGGHCTVSWVLGRSCNPPGPRPPAPGPGHRALRPEPQPKALGPGPLPTPSPRSENPNMC